MTVSTTNSVYSYDGDGSTVAFSFPRYAQSSAQIIAVVVDETTGAETSPSYTVTGAGSSWTVTFATAPASTTKVVVFRDPSVVQETDFSSEGDPRAAMTAKADLLTMFMQALRNRGLRMGNGTLQDFSPVLPNPTGAAGFSLTINDDEDGIEYREELTAGSTVSSAMSPVINGSIANALSLLGVTAQFDSMKAITTAGGTTAYTLTTGLSLSAYASGQTFLITMNATNTGASTLNVDSLGAKDLTKNGATALASGDLVSGVIYRVAYDGTRFQVVGKNTGTSGATVPLLNGINTWSGVQTHTAEVRFGAGGGANTNTNTTSVGDGIGWLWGSSIDGTNAFKVFNGSLVGVYLGSGNVTWTSTSDATLKNELWEISGALARICALRPVGFAWKSDAEQKPHVGFMAQEVEKVLPEVVSAPKHDKDHYGIRGQDFAPFLVAAMQELCAEVRALQAEVRAFKEQV